MMKNFKNKLKDRSIKLSYGDKIKGVLISKTYISKDLEVLENEYFLEDIKGIIEPSYTQEKVYLNKGELMQNLEKYRKEIFKNETSAGDEGVIAESIDIVNDKFGLNQEQMLQALNFLYSIKDSF